GLQRDQGIAARVHAGAGARGREAARHRQRRRAGVPRHRDDAGDGRGPARAGGAPQRAAQASGPRGRRQRGRIPARRARQQHHRHGPHRGRGDHGMTLPATGRPSTAKAWSRALALTAPIASRPGRTLPVVLDEIAARQGDAPALLSEHEWLTFAGLARLSRRYARWALDQGLGKGEAVALLMPNRPEYFAIWLGITRVGGVAALVSTELTGASLADCLNVARAKHLIVDAELI